MAFTGVSPEMKAFVQGPPPEIRYLQAQPLRQRCCSPCISSVLVIGGIALIAIAIVGLLHTHGLTHVGAKVATMGNPALYSLLAVGSASIVTAVALTCLPCRRFAKEQDLRYETVQEDVGNVDAQNTERTRQTEDIEREVMGLEWTSWHRGNHSIESIKERTNRLSNKQYVYGFATSPTGEFAELQITCCHENGQKSTMHFHQQNSEVDWHLSNYTRLYSMGGIIQITVLLNQAGYTQI